MDKKISILLILAVAFLITGNLIGAGILGLPIQAGLDGLIPTLVGMVIVGAAMFYTAVILSKEAVGEREETFNFPSLYSNYLGTSGKWVAILANLIILWGLLTAYLTGATTIITSLFHTHLPGAIVLIIFALLITSLTACDIAVVRRYNALLVVVMWISFAVIVAMSERYVEIKRFAYKDWGFLPMALPIMITSFHFHNIIPNVCHNLKWNFSIIWKTMLVGMLIGYLMNAMWVQVGIGALPLTGGDISLVSAFEHNLPATVPLSKEVKSSLFTTFSLLFALLAISTSYLANGRGLLGFIGDLTKNHFKVSSRVLILALSFGPPILISLIYPDIFLKALNIVGGIGIVVLFGVLPSIIAIMKARTAAKKVLAVTALTFFGFCLLFVLGQQFGLINIQPRVHMGPVNAGT